MNRSDNEIVIALIPWQSEVIDVCGALVGVPVMIAEGRPELVCSCAHPITARIRVDIRAIVLSDVGVDGRSGSVVTFVRIVIAERNDEVGYLASVHALVFAAVRVS
jgi:hypothetical protein